ncbi:ankyrin repeat domain-containing protein [Pelagicoccus mobilis]|uniref:Ankyrin repeat domain-containing protein n=1 Tax=Pelagicoccus mobilis TaxID=415221 RepID=A0A934VP82_9BACT|nr:ankyrin repeat domain-containing protein [Pelagicoccus mobilis]MBK1880716.1 ankyrin repeat domain-containing protein [Pelagicoccus mobilis]
MSGKQPKRNPRSGIDEYGRTPLINAICDGNLELAEELISKGADLDVQDDNGWCALHFASQKREKEITKILLEKGANPNLHDSHGNGPLWTATMNSRDSYEILILLIEYGAEKDWKNRHGRSPLDMALTIQNGLEKVFEQGIAHNGGKRSPLS